MRTKTPHQKRIEQFMALIPQPIPDTPTIPDQATRELRAKLIMEEALETINKGLGISIMFKADYTFNVCMDEMVFMENSDGPDLIEIVDGCADISVVTVGTLSACGVSDSDILEEVDINNLAKIGPGSSRRLDGKLVKPFGHQPPMIAEILKLQGWKGV